MRYADIINEIEPINTLSNSLANQAKTKSIQAAKLKQQASVARKREQVQKGRSKLLKQQSELTNLLSKPSQ